MLYVDELFLTKSNICVLEELATSLMVDFPMIYFGPITKYLGVNFVLYFIHFEQILLLGVWTKFYSAQ